MKIAMQLNYPLVSRKHRGLIFSGLIIAMLMVRIYLYQHYFDQLPDIKLSILLVWLRNLEATSILDLVVSKHLSLLQHQIFIVHTGKRLGYCCNPHSLMEVTETLCRLTLGVSQSPLSFKKTANKNSTPSHSPVHTGK